MEKCVEWRAQLERSFFVGLQLVVGRRRKKGIVIIYDEQFLRKWLCIWSRTFYMGEMLRRDAHN